MATTSPDNLRTPDPGDPYNLVPDLATLAGDVQSALINRANALKGTVSERGAFESTASPGVLWQDTDGIGMIWKRGATSWEPAVWRWSGTNSEMSTFTQAPAGFQWFNTTDNSEYIRLGGGWAPLSGVHSYPSTSGGSSAGWAWSTPQTVTFPVQFPKVPRLLVQTQAPGDFLVFASITALSATGFTYRVSRIGSSVGSGSVAWVASL